MSGRVLPEPKAVSVSGSTVIVSGQFTRVLAAVLEEVNAGRLPGGLEGFARRHGFIPAAVAGLRLAGECFAEAGAAAFARAESSANGNPATRGSRVARPSGAWIGSGKAGAMLGLTARRMRQLAAAGDIAAERVNGRWVFERSALLDHQEAQIQ